MYTEDIAETIAAVSLNYHLYADDTQLQKNMHIVDINPNRVNLKLCIAGVKYWCSSSRLQRNAVKINLTWFGSRSNLKKLTLAKTSLQFGSITIEPAAVVWNLSVYIDDELKMHVHIGKAAAICFFPLFMFLSVIIANFDLF